MEHLMVGVGLVESWGVRHLHVLLLEVVTQLLVRLLHGLHLGLQHPGFLIVGPGIRVEYGEGSREQGAGSMGVG